MIKKSMGIYAREVLNLSNSWKFYKGILNGSEKEVFDDTKWDSIDLPHTWNNLDGQDGGGDFYRGDGWYRKHFTVNECQFGKKVYVQFDGICQVSDVYVNGKHIGQHIGSFATFRYDITSLLRFGEDNIIAVKANNERSGGIAPYQIGNQDLWVDFTMFGGIYREVHLLITDKLQIDPLFFGSCGVLITQRNVSEVSANIEVTTKIFSHYDQTNAENCEICKVSGSMSLEANKGNSFVKSINIGSPHLWNGLKDPYLYQVIVKLLDGDTVVDRVIQPLGLRYFHIDANDGFVLNGVYYDLHGVARHQDRADKGWAISEKEHLEDFNIIREMGSTMIRLSHYQHAQHFLDLCDKNGMVTWAEVCFVGHYFNSKAFDQNVKKQMKELIYQNMNHPAIICWGLLNEINEDGIEKVTESLNNLCHMIDPTRPTTLAMHGGEPKDWGYLSDVEGHNKYFGWYKYSWYENATGEFADWADKRHKDFPERKFCISEYGAGANIYQHEANPSQPEPEGQWHSEEYQAFYHEETWKAMKERPFLWCKIIWNAFDFASDPRNEGARPGINDKGLVTHDRKIKKDAYYFYKACWTEEPFVYITERRHKERIDEIISVKVYSNCDLVELEVNGVKIGSKSSIDRIFKWKEITLLEGENTIETIGKRNDEIFYDNCRWELTRK
ncbi:MAG TPA: glycoside hydrolase family 2 TIM barrel-domain containing protein [Ruminiclostridium sp.]